MEQSVIFQPILGMIALTFIVWFRLFTTRIPAMYKIGKPADTYKRSDSLGDMPDKANFAADNFKNLFEVPILFYVLCFGMWMAGLVNDINLYLAWGYVALRALHSYIQCGPNIVMARFRVYALSTIVLMVIFVRVALAVWL